MRNALVIDEKDSVAVVIHPIKAGEEVVYAFPSGKEAKLTASQDIPLFHKVALRDVPKGDPVIKYAQRCELEEIPASELTYLGRIAVILTPQAALDPIP
jgi:altronate dehydratase small subunit